MRKLNLIILLLSFSTLIVSCGANPTKLMAKTMDIVYIGMSISEFKEIVEKEELVEMNEQVTIFRIVIKTYNDIPGIGWRSNHRSFYFENNKHVKVDKGERAIDYRIKIV